jgi:8-oxo-dGTP pyrophosphatase MutT (NUDIX family)
VKQYVLGFLFDLDCNNVVLIEKKKPEIMKGLFNGVGGHIEAYDATPQDAMTREFLEETGVEISGWQQYALLVGQRFTMHVFRAWANDFQFSSVHTMEEEIVVTTSVLDLPFMSMGNIRWLIPMALDGSIDPANIILVR